MALILAQLCDTGGFPAPPCVFAISIGLCRHCRIGHGSSLHHMIRRCSTKLGQEEPHISVQRHATHVDLHIAQLYKDFRHDEVFGLHLARCVEEGLHRQTTCIIDTCALSLSTWNLHATSIPHGVRFLDQHRNLRRLLIYDVCVEQDIGDMRHTLTLTLRPQAAITDTMHKRQQCLCVDDERHAVHTHLAK